MGRINYLLDTNIISEPARLKPNSKVLQNFAEHDGQYAVSSIVWHELNYGCQLLSDSRRKSQLEAYLSMLIENGLVILSYDQRAAEWFASQRAQLKKQGKTPAYADGEIAAIAVVNELTLVTRNTQDFSCYPNLNLANWFE